MKLSLIMLPLAATALVATGSASAKNPTVGGAAMYETKNIVENAAASPDHTTLVAAVKAAGLVDTLASAGPFTVFAPTNAAFSKLPAGTVDTLLKPENKTALTAVLTYHVVPGRLTATDLAAQARAGGGKAVLTTVQGTKLTAWEKDGAWYVSDTKGNKAKIGPADVMQSNGVIHVIDTVLMP
ncbi:Uncaracterized surface protein containing fasciclin (FAS1) repeats [Sphingopyxis sp. YR583]|uniref:fasciclin domain-containing protein n=1 Tax=Sphingopyxis sp. YR583 TaxID=1881047 RepID=UPI0008A7DEF2|nr:fasciclin domain-containing protein [Sphingopyxis sp. YR583]SEH13116.1 Uncaracterized surface protein containing fasciclin (FAS1) repeats [Sphingopyxis sp. YR583]